MKYSAFLLLFLIPIFGIGQQLVYTPINPAFGGDTFNYNWLLNSANAQNSFEDDNGFGEFGRGGDFGNLFNNSALGFGNQNQYPDIGTTTDGDLHYEVYESTEGLVINILNIVTGEQSQIIVPN